MCTWGRLAVVIVAVLVTAAPSFAAPAGSTVLVSRPDGFGPVPPAFDNNSDDPVAVSQDGRYALFGSDADGFAPGVDPFVTSLFVRDTVTGTTTLASRSDGVSGAGANRESTDGDIVVTDIGGTPHVLVTFSTFASNLVDHPTGIVQGQLGREHVWLRDVTTGETTLISRADGATGAAANTGGNDPAIAIAANGPVVAFTSSSTNLGATGSGGVYVRRVGTNDTELVSCKDKNCAAAVAASADQPDIKVVSAASGAPTCVAPHAECILVAFSTLDATITGPNGSKRQIVMAVAESGQTTTFRNLSLPDQAFVPLADAPATAPSFSGDGRAIAFLTNATNLTVPAPATGGPVQAYVRIPGDAVSVSNSRTFLLSRGTGPASAPANATVNSVDLGGTASQTPPAPAQLDAVFLSDATNLGATQREAYLRDHATSTTTILDRAPGPGGELGNRFSESSVAISGDGSAGLFASSSTNLGDGDPGRFRRIRLRRLNTAGQELELVSRPSGFAPFKALTDRTSAVAISADGRFVAFESRSASLSDEDQDGDINVFVRDQLTGRTLLASRANGATGLASRAASLGGISGDGRRVVFGARNLTSDSPLDIAETYVRDLDAQTTTLVSRANGPAGGPAATTATSPVISGDGRRVGFLTQAAFDPAGAGGNFHIYVRDLDAQTTTLVDRDDGITGAVANFGSFEYDLDGDGSRVAFTTEGGLAGTTADGTQRVFLRDLPSGTTTLVSRADGATGDPADRDSRGAAINGAGDVVAFDSGGQNLDGTFINTQVFVRDLSSADTQLVSRASGAGTISASASAAHLDAAGRLVSFSAARNLDTTVTPDPESGSRIFVRDLSTGVTTLASRGNGGGGPPADASSTFFNDISASGDCVVFSSASTNLAEEFASADFDAVYMRVLRNECPVPAPVTPPPPPGAPPPPPPPPAPAVEAKPAVLSGLVMKPRRFRVLGRNRGATITFRLDKASRVTLTFERLLPGRRKGKRCLTTVKKGRKCTVVRRDGRITVMGRKGNNTVKFTGTISRKRLAVGRHRVRAQPTAGTARTLNFAVLRAAKR